MATPVLAEEYLRNEVSKAKQPYINEAFNELIDNFI